MTSVWVWWCPLVSVPYGEFSLYCYEILWKGVTVTVFPLEDPWERELQREVHRACVETGQKISGSDDRTGFAEVWGSRFSELPP